MKDFEFFNKYCTTILERMRNCAGYYNRLNRNERSIIDDILYDRYCERTFELFSDFTEKTHKMFTEIYNKHIFGSYDLEDEEKEAIMDFSLDITSGFDDLVKEMGVLSAGGVTLYE